jgi:hypothetical protein
MDYLFSEHSYIPSLLHDFIKTKLCGFSLQANYTDRATATFRRSWCQLFWIEGVTWWAQRSPMAVNVGFLDPEPLLFHSNSSSVILMRLSGSVPDPLLLRKSGSEGNRARDLWICLQKLWPLDHSSLAKRLWKILDLKFLQWWLLPSGM